MDSRGIWVEAKVPHQEVVQEGQEVRGVQVVRGTQSEVRLERRTAVEERAVVAPDREDMVDLRMEVECLRPLVQALGQMHQWHEQEGLRTGQGSGEHNLRNSGHSTGHP
jgi:hypothetical protein